MNKPWYEETMKYEIPAFFEHVKILFAKKIELRNKRSALMSDMAKGVAFFSKETNPQEKLLEGSIQFLGLCKKAEEIEKEIDFIDGEIIGTLEAKISDIAFKIRIPKSTNETGEQINAREVICCAWKSLFVEEDKIVITPEDAWFFSLNKQLFGANPSNIEFIKTDKIWED